MIEVRNDDFQQLDEIVGRGCYVHLERMDEHWFCLIVEDSERRLILKVGTSDKYRRKVNATICSDEIPSPADSASVEPTKRKPIPPENGDWG